MVVDDRGGVALVGIGTAGIKIVSLLSRKTLFVDRYLYISCDRGDFSTVEPEDTLFIDSPVVQKLTPSTARGLALRHVRKVKGAVGRSKLVFIVAGLGGATGSGLAPLVASLAGECGATAIGVAVMPFEFEKKMMFYAGVSLRRLRASSAGVVVVDNDTLMRSSSEDSSLATLYDSANKAAVKALGSMLSAGAPRPLGLNKLLGTVAQEGYSLLGAASSVTEDKAEDALSGAVVSLGKLAETKDAARAVVSLNGDRTLSAKEVGVAVDRLGPLMDNEEMEVEYGVDESGSAQLQVSLIASGFGDTKYDDYDPLAKVLGDRVLDEEMDVALPEGLEALQPCD